MEFSFESNSFEKVWGKLKQHINNETMEDREVSIGNPYPCLKDFIINFDIKKFQKCTYCIKQPVFDLEKAINNFFEKLTNGNQEAIIYLEPQIELLLEVIGIIFNYCQEYRFKDNPVKRELARLVWFITTSQFFYKNTLFYYGVNTLPFDLIHEKYQESKLQEIEPIREKIGKCIQHIEEWDSDFQNKKEAIEELENNLKRQKNTYDFVFLNEGFKNLYNQKKKI